MCPVRLRGILCSTMFLVFPMPLRADDAPSFKDEYDAIVHDFHREASAARGKRQELTDAKRRFDSRLESCLERIKASSGGSAAEKDLIVAVAIAERLSRGQEVVSLCDHILRHNPRCDAAIYARLRGLLSMGRLEDAEQHVRQVLQGADELSDYHSMSGLLLAAFSQRRQWQKGLEFGDSFLRWCSRKIRAQGAIDVSVSHFLELFDTCADEACESGQVDRLVAEMLRDVSKAIDVKNAGDDAGTANLNQLEFLFRLKHHLCCLSPESDPGACAAEWLMALRKQTGDAPTQAVAGAIASAASASSVSLCLSRDLDLVQRAVGDCRIHLENLTPAPQPNDLAIRGIAELRRLEGMIQVERQARGAVGRSLGVLDKVEWHVEPEGTMGGSAPMIVFVWAPSGRNPGLTLRQNVSMLHGISTLPLVVISPYTEGPAMADDAIAERRQKERVAVRRHTESVSGQIAVGCIDGKLLSRNLAVTAFPQVYLIDPSGKVEVALIGIGKWQLERLKKATEMLPQANKRQ